MEIFALISKLILELKLIPNQISKNIVFELLHGPGLERKNFQSIVKSKYQLNHFWIPSSRYVDLDPTGNVDRNVNKLDKLYKIILEFKHVLSV